MTNFLAFLSGFCIAGIVFGFIAVCVEHCKGVRDEG